MFKIFKKKNPTEKDKDKQQTTNQVRVRVLRMDNDTPVESYDFQTNIIKDENNNRVIKDDELQFKEELSYLRHGLVSDVLFKVKHRLDSKKAQIDKLKEAIKKQEDLVNSIKDGKVEVEEKKKTENDDLLSDDIDLSVSGEKKKIKVNVHSEKVKLNVLKVSLYTLENEGQGSFSRIGIDGVRVLEYVLEDGDLKPVFFKSAKLQDEPVKLYVDQSQKKKYYKENDNMIEEDYMAQTSSPFKGFAMLIIWGFFILLVLGNVWLFMDNNARSDSLDERAMELQDKYDNSAVMRLVNAVEEKDERCMGVIENIINGSAKKELSDYVKKEKEVDI